jgi:hypothetical protein
MKSSVAGKSAAGWTKYGDPMILLQASYAHHHHVGNVNSAMINGISKPYGNLICPSYN